eukprot:TRINITY_DN1988_c0_g2_i10.p1 TRINITY_DN1988_c0_g2~~TRINITY_DN1988_c0_g2_i10.p1  ORF type:complete len:564 (+),score=126.68 TRINITY_DN1988_c0_g2_i10:175-1866(+)
MKAVVKKSKTKDSTKMSSVKVGVPRILENEIQTTHLLGEGAYGQVWKGVCRSNPVAVKYIHPDKYDPDSFLAELTLLFQANNQHIVQLQGVVINDKDQPVGIVTEFLEGGDLEHLLHPEGIVKTISVADKIHFGIDICKGMGWLAGKELTIIHRDLKPANIMLDREQKHCKICDFGLAVSNEGKRGKRVGDAKSTRGSPLWMAPERIVNKIIKEKELMDELKTEVDAFKKRVGLDKMTNINMSEKSDVYSFGVMFWEMLTQAWPFVDLITTESYTELFTIILSGKRPSVGGIEPELAKIISDCWQQDPEKRPRFSEVVVMLQNSLITLELPVSACPDAAKFWIKKFTMEQTSVRVADLVTELVNERFITDEMKETVLVCIYGLLTGKVIDLPPNIANYDVDLKDFGNIVKWFGPLKQGGIMNMVSMMQTSYFFGLLEKTEADNLLLLNAQDKHYLVRLNTGGSVAVSASPFVISIFSKGKKATCVHLRVFPRHPGTYGKWVCQAGKEKVRGDSLKELLANLTQSGVLVAPLEPNPFAPLWSVKAIPEGLYGADPELQDLSEDS